MSLEIANICYFTIFACSVASGSITEPPLDTEAEINEPANFSCVVDKNANEIEWDHAPVGSTTSETFYAGEVVLKPYRNRFTVSNCSDNELKLILTIRNVSTYDAGRYTCNDGNNTLKSAELSVFDTIPSSESCHIQYPSMSDVFIGNNDCGLKQDVINITCKFRYFGNKSPSLVWNVENQTSISPDVVLTNDNVNMSSVQFDATVNKNVICSIQYSDSTEPASRFKWTTSVQVETFMNISDVQNTNCNSSAISCTYQFQSRRCESMWVRKNGSFVSREELKPDELPGVYVCVANCSIGSKSCVFQQLTVNHTCANDSSTAGSSDVVFIVVTVGGVVCVVGLLCLIVYFVWKKRENDMQFCCRTATEKTNSSRELQSLTYVVDVPNSNEPTMRKDKKSSPSATSNKTIASHNAGSEDPRNTVPGSPEIPESGVRRRGSRNYKNRK